MAFLTNFHYWQYPAYKRAVKTWRAPGDFTVSKLNKLRRANGYGSLHYFGRRGADLSEFWRHFESVFAEFRKLEASGATDDELRAFGDA